jgi:hypothetical protein
VGDPCATGPVVAATDAGSPPLAARRPRHRASNPAIVLRSASTCSSPATCTRRSKTPTSCFVVARAARVDRQALRASRRRQRDGIFASRAGHARDLGVDVLAGPRGSVRKLREPSTACSLTTFSDRGIYCPRLRCPLHQHLFASSTTARPTPFARCSVRSRCTAAAGGCRMPDAQAPVPVPPPRRLTLMGRTAPRRTHWRRRFAELTLAQQPEGFAR